MQAAARLRELLKVIPSRLESIRPEQASHKPASHKWSPKEAFKSAHAIVAEGGPEKAVTPGEWKNVSMCCGVAAEGEFFLDLYRVTKDRQYLDLAKKASDRLLALATKDSSGYRWVQVETHVRPDIAVAQTGYMQGASGIGLRMLHFDAALRNEKKLVIKFPDNPFDF
jgi:uncharacterized protein YyaL (SSP411 family)